MPTAALLLLWIVLCVNVLADDAVPVGVAAVRSAMMMEEVALHGTLVAVRTSRLSTEVDGLVEAVHADDGDRVKRDAVLVELDRRIAEIELSQAAAELEAAVATVKETRRRHLELKALKETRHVAESVAAAQAAQIEIDQAAVSAAKARLARNRQVLRQHSIRAPFDAVVRRKSVERGEWVENNTTLLELVDVSNLRLDVPVPQQYFAEVEEQTAVEIRFDALPKNQFEAQVTRKIPVSDPASRTFRVRIDLANDEGILAPGMSARVVLKLIDNNREAPVVVPRDAIVRKPDGSVRVWVVVTEDGVTKAIPRPVETGRSYRDHFEVLNAAVAPGDRVIVRGNEILRPGQSILIAEEIELEL